MTRTVTSCQNPPELGWNSQVVSSRSPAASLMTRFEASLPFCLPRCLALESILVRYSSRLSGARPSSHAAIPGRLGSSWGITATKTRSSFSRTASGQSFGNRVDTPYFGASKGSVGSRSIIGSAGKARITTERNKPGLMNPLLPTSQVSDVIRRVRADFLAVEHVERAEPLEQLAAEPLERQVDDLAAVPASQPAPGGLGRARADDRHVAVMAVEERRGQQPLLER